MPTRCRLDALRGASLNAFITLHPEHVLDAARARLGLLHGLPIPLKDSVNTHDYPTTAGTPALRYFRPREDAPLAPTLRAEGAIVLGKNNMHELARDYTSNNQAYGAVHNPYDPSRIPGGGSGGTAASISYRMAPLGVAEDTAGSIRVPAALRGIAGFRQTTGRYPSFGVAPASPLFDQLGPHARAVEDLLPFDSALTGTAFAASPPSLKGVRLGVIRPDFWTDLDPQAQRITSGALETLRKSGVELVEGDLAQVHKLIARSTDRVTDHDFRPAVTRSLTEYHTGLTFDELIAQASPDIPRTIGLWLKPGRPDFLTDGQYEQIVKVYLPALKTMYRQYFERTGVAAIVFSAMTVPAPPIEASAREEDRSVEVAGRRMLFDNATSRNVAPGSTAGLPGAGADPRRIAGVAGVRRAVRDRPGASHARPRARGGTRQAAAAGRRFEEVALRSAVRDPHRGPAADAGPIGQKGSGKIVSRNCGTAPALRPGPWPLIRGVCHPWLQQPGVVTQQVSVAARAAAATIAAARALTLLGFVHLQGTPVEIGAIQRLHGARGIGGRHLHEAEAAGPAGVTVRNQRNLLDRSMLREQGMDGLFGRREREISNV